MPLKGLLELISLCRMRETFTVHWCMSPFGIHNSTETGRVCVVRRLRLVSEKNVRVSLSSRPVNNDAAERSLEPCALHRMR
jgi:hypothetical protein